jgi:ABC-2 type transport system ATP-binding protein
MSDGTEAPPLEIADLSKSFRSGLLGRRTRPALLGLNLRMVRGEILGYLGPNGSGKTTTLKILMGLVAADGGTARVLGKPLDDRSWRSRIGFLPEQPYFYDYLTPAEYLDYVGRVFGLPPAVRHERARSLIQRVGLGASLHVSMRRFSKGMLQRVGIAQALINDPEIVFLDEPMSGLDPIGRHMVRGVILDLKRQGRTVFFSTHILPDAEALCDRVALLRTGRLLKVGRLDEILGQEIPYFEVLLSGGSTADLDPLEPGVRIRERLGERWRLEVEESALTPVLRAATAGGARVLSVLPIRLSLEEFFFSELGGQEEER